MTTFQDPQPHSRRAARETERAAQAAQGAESHLPPDFDDSELRPGAGRRARMDDTGSNESHAVPTQARYDSSPFRVTVPEPAPSAPQFRQRDFSPEGRMASVPPPPSARLTARPVEEPAAGQPQRGLTRRELRLLEQQSSAVVVDRPQPATDPAPLVEPQPESSSREALDEAVTSMDRITGFEAFLRAPQEPAQAPEAEPAPSRKSVGWPGFATAQPAHDDVDTDVDEVLQAQQTPSFAEPPVQRESYTPPPGHWSRQADLDDETQPYENTLSREVGGGAVTTTTSALILPSIPQDDFAAAINGTGEILITGSINLPRGFGTTGADHRKLDDPNVDRMFEAFDGELVSNDSQPVRAIRAVSTHTATQGVIVQPRKTRGNRLFVVGIVAASVLAVAVVGLLAFYVFKIA